MTSDHNSTTSRRAVLGSAAALGVAAFGTVLGQSPAQATGNQTHILAGLGTINSRYTPSITPEPRTYGVHAEAIFAPPLSCADEPTRLLVSCFCDGNLTSGCTGAPTAFNLNGRLVWSDDTHSSYHVDQLLHDRVEGHVINKDVCTIQTGHYAGGTLTLLGLRLAGNVTGCLTSSGISSASGYVIAIVNKP